MIFQFAPLMFLGVLLIPALLIGLIFLLIKGGPAIRWILGILVLLTTLGVFFGMFNAQARPVVVHKPSVNAQMHAETTVEPLSQSAGIQVIKDPVVWSEGMEEELTPAVYSSLQAAAYGLGVQLQQTLSALPQQPEQVVLLQQGQDVDIVLLEQLRRGVKFVFPDIAVMIAEEASAKDQLQISLQVKDVQEHPIQIPETQNGAVVQMAQEVGCGNRQGTLQAVIQTADNKYVQQVRFDRRQWLDDAEGFRSLVGRGKWTVIASDQTAVTKDQAAEQLTLAAINYLGRQSAMASPMQPSIHADDLQNYGFIVDEYYQRLQGLSGPIWRGALLLEVSPERLQLLQKDKTVVIKQVRKTWVWRIFSLLVMILLISVLYAVVNAITKGYYSVMSAVLAIGLVLIFVLFLFLT